MLIFILYHIPFCNMNYCIWFFSFSLAISFICKINHRTSDDKSVLTHFAFSHLSSVTLDSILGFHNLTCTWISFLASFLNNFFYSWALYSNLYEGYVFVIFCFEPLVTWEWSPQSYELPFFSASTFLPFAPEFFTIQPLLVSYLPLDTQWGLWQPS
jgi:hypothetical protein